jgi:hypothetical protein
MLKNIRKCHKITENGGKNDRKCRKMTENGGKS